MKEIRATFYDLRGYFVPGVIMLWALSWLFVPLGWGQSVEYVFALPPVTGGVLMVVICYSLGHALHAIANFTIDRFPFSSYPPKDYFCKRFQEDFSPEAVDAISAAVREMMGIRDPITTDRENLIKRAYWPCFQYVMNSQNAETESLLSLTGFYRGMTTAMLSIAMLYGIAFWRGLGDVLLGWAALCAFVFGLLFGARARRFNYYLAKTVYANFLCLSGRKTSQPVTE